MVRKNYKSQAVIYARVSTREQKEGYSIDAQVKLLKEYAEKNNMKIEKEFIDVESASKAGRQKFNEMIKYTTGNNQQKCESILVEKTDRLTRNMKDYVTIDELITEKGIAIHLVKESEIISRDSNSHQKFIHGIKVILAKNYSDNLREEVKKGMREKASQGIFPSRAPIGYRNVRDGQKSWIEIDPDYAPHVIKAFKLYSTGEKSINNLMVILHDDGLRSRHKGKKPLNGDSIPCAS